MQLGDSAASEEIQKLLNAMKEEHEVNLQQTKELDAQHERSTQALADTHERIRMMDEEVAQIRERTSVSAGNARQLAEVLDAEKTERAALQAEVGRLESQLGASAVELEAIQCASAEQSLATLVAATGRRNACRRQCREARDGVKALACTLSILEAEIEVERE